MTAVDYYLSLAQRSLSQAGRIHSIFLEFSQDPRGLIGVFENIHDVQKHIIALLLSSFDTSRSAKQAHSLSQNNFKEAITTCHELYKNNISFQHILTSQDITDFETVFDILNKHDHSPIELRKRSTFIVFDNDYNKEILTSGMAETILGRTRTVLKRIVEHKSIVQSQLEQTICHGEEKK
ncbi:MAG: hypothetical protein ACQESC_02340 [Nanobdellota archaeon]